MVQYYCLQRVDFSPLTNVQFTTCQWRLPPIVYLLYRVILAIYALFCLFDSFLEFQKYYHVGQNATQFKIHPWPFYLSNIAYLILTIYLVLNAGLICFYVCRRKSKDSIFKRPSVEYLTKVMKTRCENVASVVQSQAEANGNMLKPLGSSEQPEEDCQEGEVIRTPNEQGHSYIEQRYSSLYLSDKVTWIFYIIASNTAITVTIGYFILKVITSHMAILHTNILHVFVFNSVIILFDNFLTSIPVKPLHFVYVSAFGLFYELLTIFNCFALWNNRALYGVLLDWYGSPGYSVLSMFIVLFVWIPFVQCLLYLLFKCRNLFFKALYLKHLP